jgi:hypothetical protein
VQAVLSRTTFPRKSIDGLHSEFPRLGTSTRDDVIGPSVLRHGPQNTGFVGGFFGSCASMFTS